MGTSASGFDIPSAAISGGGQSWHQARIERLPGPPLLLHRRCTRSACGSYPSAKDTSAAIPCWCGPSLVGGNSPTSIPIHSGSSDGGYVQCLRGRNQLPEPGQCMPGHHSWRNRMLVSTAAMSIGPSGTSACNLGLGPGCKAVAYVDSTKFQNPGKLQSANPNLFTYLIGNAPRTQPLNLRNPGTQDLDASLRRSFPLPKDLWDVRLRGGLPERLEQGDHGWSPA